MTSITWSRSIAGAYNQYELIKEDVWWTVYFKLTPPSHMKHDLTSRTFNRTEVYSCLFSDHQHYQPAVFPHRFTNHMYYLYFFLLIFGLMIMFQFQLCIQHCWNRTAESNELEIHWVRCRLFSKTQNVPTLLIYSQEGNKSSDCLVLGCVPLPARRQRCLNAQEWGGFGLKGDTDVELNFSK